jgi:hypothetical protein
MRVLSELNGLLRTLQRMNSSKVNEPWYFSLKRFRPAFAGAASRRQVQGFGKLPAAIRRLPGYPPSVPAESLIDVYCNVKVYSSKVKLRLKSISRFGR